MLPKGFILPNGKACSVRVYVASWKKLKTLPAHEEINGWNWYSTPVRWILNSIRDGIHDRINQRGGLKIRELSPDRLHRLRSRHAA